MIVPTQGDKKDRPEVRQFLEDQAVGTLDGVIWNIKCISPMTIIIPIMIHTGYVSKHKHLIDSVMSFLKQHSTIDKFNQLWAIILPNPGFASFNKAYSQVTQCI